MPEESFKRKLTAILSADVEGYSRLMGEDEDATIRTLTTYRELMSTLIQKHRGRVVDSPGDNLLAEFNSVVDAVRCAVEIQEELRVRNAELPENRRMEFRIGINLGDVIEEGERIYGDGVNITARVEGLAEGGGICISGTVYDSIKNKLSLSYESLGEHTVKNITEPVRVYRMRVGPEAAATVAREEKAGPRRWQKAALAAVVTLVVAAGVWALWNFYFRPPPIEPASVEKMTFPLPDKPSIAVLPFVNLSGDPEQEYFADAMSDNITTELSRFEYLFVISRHSAFVYKGSKKTIKQISQELGVRYLLEGSVQRSDNQVRINVQLIDAISGKHVWAEKFDRHISNIFAIQDEITQTVVATLSEKIWQVSAKALTKKPLSNFKAWDYYLKGRVHIQRGGKQENATARALYEKALELDPDLSEAYIGLAWTYYLDWRFGYVEAKSEAIDKAEALAKKAAAFGENSASLQFLLSRIALGRGRYDEALAHHERALELNPNDGELIATYGFLLIYAGRSEESLLWIKKAMRLNPYYPAIYATFLAAGYYFTKRYSEAVEAIVRKGRLILGDHQLLAASYAQLGRLDEAQVHVKEILKMNPQFTLSNFQTYLQRVYKTETDVEHLIDGLRKAGLK